MLESVRYPVHGLGAGTDDDKEGRAMIGNEAANLQIVDGMTVYGADGDKLGMVRNYDPESGYVDIQKGWLFHKDFYVGLAAIVSVDEHGITCT
jgi:hypothetical protein